MVTSDSLAHSLTHSLTHSEAEIILEMFWGLTFIWTFSYIDYLINLGGDVCDMTTYTLFSKIKVSTNNSLELQQLTSDHPMMAHQPRTVSHQHITTL